MLKWIAFAAVVLTALPASANNITITGEDNLGNTATNTAPSPVNFGPTPVGNWSAQGTATGTPPAPSGTLLSNTIAFNTTGAGSFTLWVTETGLTSPLGVTAFTSSLTANTLTGGVTGATLLTALQTDDSVPGPGVPTGTTLDSHLFTTIDTQTATLDADTGAGPFSLTEEYIITATAAGGADLTAVLTTAVPEPGSLILFGTGLFGLWSFARRRRAPRAA